MPQGPVEVVWEDPPEDANLPALPKYGPKFKALDENPGRWQMVFESGGKSEHGAAKSTYKRLRQRYPEDKYEYKTKGRKLWARRKPAEAPSIESSYDADQ